MQSLRALEARWNEPELRHPRFVDKQNPIKLNIGKIEGGDWASSVPAWCTFDCRIAMFPGINAANAAQEITDCVNAAAINNLFLAKNPPRVEFNGFLAEGYEFKEGSAVEEALAKAHQFVFNKQLGSMTFPGYVDARVFQLYDDCPCLVYGPIAENIHGFDERVSLSSIKNVTGTIALLIADWCGLESIDIGDRGMKV
jgi:acetylornithine deacetylase